MKPHEHMKHHPGVWSQMRDWPDNDNQSDQMRVEAAQAMRRWADTRADEPAFAAMVDAARRHAAVVRQQSRPRSVR